VLPYGKDNQQGAVRFQYDTLRKWQTADYLLGHYLLDMNLLPRQFIGALGGLKVVGEEQLDPKEPSTKVIHLKADPKEDPLALKDSAINRFWGLVGAGSNRVPLVQLYFDPQKKAIIRIVIQDQENSGFEVELKVTDWKDYGADGIWPSKWEGRQIAVFIKDGLDTRPPLVIHKPVLSVVDKFDTVQHSEIDLIAKQVAQISFFGSPLTELRTSDYYRDILAKTNNLSDRAALAAAYFSERRMADGQVQWAKIASDLHDLQNRRRLDRFLGTPAIAPLDDDAQSFAGVSKAERGACSEVIKQLVNSSLTVDEFRPLSYGVAFAWHVLRQVKDTQSEMNAVSGVLVSRIASQGNVFAIETLVQAAESNKEDAETVDPALSAEMSKSMPDAGFDKSQQDYIIIAAIRAKALDRAQRYLTDVHWAADATDEKKLVAVLWSKAISTVKGLEANNDKAVFDAIDLYMSFETKLPKGASDRAYGMWMLTGAGGDFLSRRINQQTQGISAQELIRGTVKANGADRYWGSLFEQEGKARVTDPQYVVTDLTPMIKIYAEAFKLPKFETDFWLQLGKDRVIAGRALGVEIMYLNKALGAASDDESRTRAIRAIAEAYARVREYAKAGNACQQASELVKDESMKKQILDMAKALLSHAEGA
jgi:hypothetical protein